MSTRALISGERGAARPLVVVFLRGAADGLALVSPWSDPHLPRARPRLRPGERAGARLDDRFALHLRLAPLLEAWREGELAVVHACGIAEETRSHFEAQDLMEHGGVAAGGWLGRYLQTRPAAARGALAGVAIGRALPECLLGAPGAAVLERLEDFSLGAAGPAWRTQLEQLYAMERGRLGAAARDTFAALLRVEEIRRQPAAEEGGAAYGRDEFSTGLRRLAQLLKADVGVEAAAVDLPGWDSHFAQEAQVDRLADRLATGLAAFRRDLGKRWARTTVVVMTEFGRTVEENSAFGTDHGRGGAMFVLGGGVAGGKVLGAWRGLSPEVLEPRGLLEGYGDLPVLNNYRDVLAPVLRAHGAGAADLAAVFPGHRPALLPVMRA